MVSGASTLRLAASIAALALPFVPCSAQQSPTVPVDTLWATVHGHRIAFFVAGDSAAPVVVLEMGGGDSNLAWGSLPSMITGFARVVTYDRPGYGLSEPCDRSRSAAVIAEELHQALTALKLTPPFVLGGWSLGGSIVRVFGAMFPEAVTGIVLIDPAPEDFYVRAAQEHPDLWTPMLTEQNQRAAVGDAGARAEWEAWDVTMLESRRSDSGLVAPVILLTASNADDELQPLWIDAHRRWAGRMPNVRHILVEHAGHAIHRDRPDAVLDALRAVLGKVHR